MRIDFAFGYVRFMPFGAAETNGRLQLFRLCCLRETPRMAQGGGDCNAKDGMRVRAWGLSRWLSCCSYTAKPLFHVVVLGWGLPAKPTPQYKRGPSARIPPPPPHLMSPCRPPCCLFFLVIELGIEVSKIRQAINKLWKMHARNWWRSVSQHDRDL